MDAFGPYRLGDSTGGSARFYPQWRRRRQWTQRGLEGYAAFLMGAAPEQGQGLAPGLVGAEVAAFDAEAHPGSFLRPVAIGVATGVLTFLINRWLERSLR